MAVHPFQQLSPSGSNNSRRVFARDLPAVDCWLSMACIRPDDGQACIVYRDRWKDSRTLTFKLTPSSENWYFVGATHHKINAHAKDLLWLPADFVETSALNGSNNSRDSEFLVEKGTLSQSYQVRELPPLFV